MHLIQVYKERNSSGRTREEIRSDLEEERGRGEVVSTVKSINVQLNT